MAPPENDSELAKLTPEKKAAFLEMLEECGNVSNVCRAIGHPRATLYKAREADPEFAVAWDDAIDVAVSELEVEVRRRALQGVSKPVYQGGVEVGTIQEYSDTLAMFLLKAHRPETYRERHQIDHSGQIQGGVVVVPSTLAPGEWERAARGETPEQS